MKQVFLNVAALILFGTIYTSCTPPEAIDSKSDTEVFTVDPANDGKVDDNDYEETGED